MAINCPKGTRDLLPDEALFWKYFKNTAEHVFGVYGYVPIETPIIEQTELFVRGIGEATDVVSKEMFSAISGANLKTLLETGQLDAKHRLSLRPEGTAGVVRAIVQHGLVPPGAPPAKLMYSGPMFRAENPQKGRQRQFNQVGIECLGADDPTIDAEGIVMLMRFFTEIGIPSSDMRLLVNSMGCENCRPAYRQLVYDYLKQHEQELCGQCSVRMETNPLRAFDCKEKSCVSVMEDAPKITDHLCDDCREHYEQVLSLISNAGLTYIQDPSLVRGLDYYTRTVFEVQTGDERAQSAIGGGGRYDKLAEEIGGKPLPGFGFALGYERCLLALQEHGFQFDSPKHCEVFIACATDDVRSAAFELAQICRDQGIRTELDHQQRSLKSQFKVADKLRAAFVAILGPDELSQGLVKVRNMNSHEESLVSIAETPAYIKNLI